MPSVRRGVEKKEGKGAGSQQHDEQLLNEKLSIEERRF
jgi:hypothetical protein